MPDDICQLECEEAYENPSCPYVTQININTNCMKNVEKTLIALMGSDGTGLNDGVIHEILTGLNSLKKTRGVTASWVNILKPVVVSVVITAVTTYLIAKLS